MKTIASAMMRLDKITKGAIRYSDMDTEEDSPITVIYLRKSGLKEPYPTEIELLVKVQGSDE